MSGIPIALATALLLPAAQTSQTVAGSQPSVAKEAKCEARLAEVLRKWEQAMQELREYRYTLTCTRTDTTFGRQPSESHSAVVHICRPERLRVEVCDAGGKAEFTVVCRDSQIRLYDFRQRRFIAGPSERPAAVPRLRQPARPGPQWLLDRLDEMRWIVLGFPVSELAEKFSVTLEKEDENWTYLRLTAKARGWWCPPSDWQIVLARKGSWVRRCTQYNGGDVTIVDFTPPRTGRNPRATWEPPFDRLPVGWTTPP